jgi:hypothetical protein
MPGPETQSGHDPYYPEDSMRILIERGRVPGMRISGEIVQIPEEPKPRHPHSDEGKAEIVRSDT